MGDAAKLYEMQKIDLTWDKVRRRLPEIQSLLGETEELKSSRQRVTQAETELHQWRSKQKDAELESQMLADRIQNTENKLMSGQVRNPKELESLHASLEALRRQRAIVEDHGVEAMIMVDQLAGDLKDSQSTMAQIEGAWTNGQSELRQEELKLKQNYVLLKQKREALARELGAALMERYEQLRKRKAGVAVAPLQKDICGACHVRVPTGVASAARSSEGPLVTCTSCGRILYIA